MNKALLSLVVVGLCAGFAAAQPTAGIFDLTGAVWQEDYNGGPGQPGSTLDATFGTMGAISLALDSTSNIGTVYVTEYSGTLNWDGFADLVAMATVTHDINTDISTINMSGQLDGLYAYSLEATALETWENPAPAGVFGAGAHGGELTCGTMDVVPEPISMSLLGLGGLALLRRRVA